MEKRTETMEQITARIKQRRSDLHYSLQDVADLTGMSKSTLQRYETGGIKNIPLDKLKTLADALKVSPNWLLGTETPTGRHTARRIPVYGSVPAGIPVEAIEDILDWEELDEDQFSPSADYMALQVKGTSMVPKYQDGDIVIIEVMPDCESGQDAVVYVNGYDATLKRVVKRPDSIILQPLNPEFEPQVFFYEDGDIPVKILGIVVEMRRKILPPSKS